MEVHIVLNGLRETNDKNPEFNIQISRIFF